VSIHGRTPDGSLAPVDFPLVKDPEFYSGGGGLYSTAHDCLAFLQMIMRRGIFNGAQILRPETVAQMSQNEIADINVPKLWKTIVPQLSNDVNFSVPFPNQDLKWSLSFLINTQPGVVGRSAGSLSWAGLANTYYWLDPTRHRGDPHPDPARHRSARRPHLRPVPSWRLQGPCQRLMTG
jgi:methyl acetate hydrolase